MADFGAYGVVPDLRSVPRDHRFDQLLDDIAVRGFAALPNALSSDHVDHLNTVMDQVYARQCREVGGEDQLARMADADIARCLLAYDKAFLALATDPILAGVSRAMLGENVVLLMQNGVINRPGRRQAQARWHRDLNYQHWVCSRPIAMSALVCLEDFNLETGGTTFLPGSHLLEQFPPEAMAERNAVTPELSRGSIIFFNSMVFHRAGLNQSGRVRRAVNHVIGVPILTQQVDIPAMLDQEPPADPWLAGYLGYRWNPTPDVAAWRLKRIAQSSASETS
jgi:ectoine hydroxylase-related dioxygenase (phytanoyl-CoA dioxygenase family)